MAIKLVAAEGYDEMGYCPVYDFTRYGVDRDIIDFLGDRIQYMIYGADCCDKMPCIFHALDLHMFSIKLSTIIPDGTHKKIHLHDVINWRQIPVSLHVDENLNFSIYGPSTGSGNIQVAQDDKVLAVLMDSPDEVNVYLFMKGLCKQ